MATPLPNVPSDATFVADRGDISTGSGESHTYNIDDQFLKLCRKHANEQQQFIIQHQRQQLALLSSRLDRAYQLRKLSDEVAAWRATHYSAAQAPAVQDHGLDTILVRLVDLTIRAEWPKTQMAVTKERSDASKRKQPLREANDKYESLCTNAVAALAAIDAKPISQSSKENNQGVINLE